MTTQSKLQLATFAGGCFWCTEAIFKRIKGVQSVVSGYSGGNKQNPTYDEVSSGDTGAQEAIQITYDESIVSFTKLLEIFFKTHDPTSYDRQGADSGSQYRSVVFYHTDTQKSEVQALIKKLDNAHVFGSKIVTDVVPFKSFYEAEPYHQDFYDRNRDYGYCQVVINPKLYKLYKEFSAELKEDERSPL